MFKSRRISHDRTIESELCARDRRRAPCRVAWPGLCSQVRVKTAVVVLVGTISIDVQLYPRPVRMHILRNIFFFISREWIIPWMMDGQHKRIVRNDHDVGSWWWYRSPGRRQLRTYYRFPGGRSPSSFLCCCSPEKKEEERAHSEKRKNIYQREWIVVIDAL